MSVPKRNINNIDEYWKRLSVRVSYLFHHLRGKAEYGSCAGESGVQRAVLFTAEKIAKERNMNANLVSALCQAVALCFPERGFAELSVIKELIRKRNLDIALDTLEIDAIEYAVFQSGSTVTPELDMLLRHYYSGDESVPEVNLVRFLQKYLNLNRKLLCGCSFADSGQIVDEIMKRAKDEYETSYRLLPDPIVQPLPQNLKEEIENNTLRYIHHQDDIRAGIYEAIVY